MGDLTPYVCYASLDTVLGNLKFDSDLAIVWFEAKYIKFNSGQQYHEIIIKFTNNTIEKITYFLMQEQIHMDITEIIWKNNNVKLLSLTFDIDLKFDREKQHQ